MNRTQHLFIAAALVAACGQPLEPTRAAPLLTRETPVPTTDDATRAPARLQAVEGPNLAAAADGSTLQVPALQLAFRGGEDADYVQILRCQPGARLETALGEPAASIARDDPSRGAKLEYVWRNAIADTNSCRVITTMSAQSEFRDLSAPSGTWLYVINPCFFGAQGKATCAFDLWITNELVYENALQAEFLERSRQLADAEGRLTATYLRLQAAARSLRRHQSACEQQYAVEESIRNFWKGVGSFSAAAIGAYVGPALFGPMSAWQGARAGLDLAIRIFGSEAPRLLKCPTAESIRAAQGDDVASLDSQLAQVLQLRRDLASQNAAYGAED